MSGLNREVVKGLRKSKAIVGPLHPIIKDAYGNTVAGLHREKADPEWPVEVHPEIKTEKDRVLVRIHENYRKPTPRNKVKAELLELAEILVEEGVPENDVAMEISKIVPYTPRYVQRLLPAKYKRSGGYGRNELVRFELTGDDYRVYCKSSEDMSEVEDGSVHLIVTSPPYNADKPYDVYHDLKPLHEYRNDFITPIIRESYRKLVAGGRIAIVIPMVMKLEDETTFMPLLYSEILGECGFTIRDAVIWQKSKGLSIPEGTAWGSWCSPKNPYMRSIAEFILIAHKEAPTLEGENPDIQPQEFRDWTKNVWIIPPVSSPGHPSVFPEELATRLIKLYSYPGQLVLDPFCGVGTVGVACVRLNRRFIGYDVSENYCNITRRKILDAQSNLIT